MKKIGVKNFQKLYILHLLPTLTKNGELPYIATAEEVALWDKWLLSLLKQLVHEPLLFKNMLLRIDQLKKYGGVVASLQTVKLPLHDSALAQPLVYLDLNYAVGKDVQFFIGGIDATPTVASSDKLTGLLNRFMKELYAGHDSLFLESTRDGFIEELFLVDDVDMVVDEQSRLKLQVDRTLRDYLIALNSRLRINA